MNSEQQKIFIKEGGSSVIKTLVQDSLKENEDLSSEMKLKTLDMFKKGQIGLHQMKNFVSTEIVESSCEFQIEKDEDTDEMKLLKILNSVAATTVPDGLFLKHSDIDKTLAGIFSHKDVKKDTIFGAYTGVSVCDRQDAYKNGYCWDIYKNNNFHHCVDARNPSESNWMRYVNPTDSSELQNLEAFQKGYQVFFRVMKDIPAGRELLVWYSLQYNQDCHQCIPNLKSKSGKSLEEIVLSISQLHEHEHTYKCYICDKAFTQLSSLTKHNRTHTGEKPFKCDLCDKAFTQISSLTTHNRSHTGDKPFMCDICDKTFITKYHLTRHKRIHTGEKPYKCDVCVKAFTQKSSLESHKHIHAEEKPFKCDTCNKTFNYKSNLISHKRIHTGEKLFVCDVCDKSFSQMYILSRHKLIHTGEQPFRCDVCDKAFVHRSNLNEHMRIHTGEKPFKCDLCDKAFLHRSHLNEHTFTHSGEKPFKCELCDKSYRRKSHLNQHNNTHSLFKKPELKIPQCL